MVHVAHIDYHRNSITPTSGSETNGAAKLIQHNYVESFETTKQGYSDVFLSYMLGTCLPVLIPVLMHAALICQQNIHYRMYIDSTEGLLVYLSL